MTTSELQLTCKSIFPIGLGTFGYGESGIREDPLEINIMLDSMSRGINYLVVYPTYSKGHTIELVAQALQRAKLKPYTVYCAYPHPHKSIDEFLAKFQHFLNLAGLNKVETFMLSGQMEGSFGRKNSVNLMKNILSMGLADDLGVCNFNIEQLNYYYQVFGHKIVLHELCHNFEIRIFQDLGIIERNRELGIQTVSYQPLRRNRTVQQNWPLLKILSKKYGKTQNQIILRWLNQLNIIALVKAKNIAHFNENISSYDFTLEEKDIEKLNNHRVVWDIPKLNWLDFDSTDGIYVAKLSNIIDQYI